MKKTLTLAALFACMQFYSQDQNSNCGSPVPSDEWNNWFNSKVKEFIEQAHQGRGQQATYSIPVVVHVVHGGQSIGTYPNITQNQIKSQISALNSDLAGTGYNSQLVPSAFSSAKADCNISFCLAERDPQGNPLSEPGIHRIRYQDIPSANPANQGNSTLKTLMDNTIKPATIWDPTRYCNIWITERSSSSNLLGYAYFPAGTGLSGLGSTTTGGATTDGIWVYTSVFGTTGSVSWPYDKGRTLTHEVGHWLGIRHIGGDGQPGGVGGSVVAGTCSATDYCNDTPPQKGGNSGGAYGQNFGSPFFPLHAGVCASTGDMYMNFMDYTDDAAKFMFTNDQRTRMQTTMANGTYRKFLSASASTLCNIQSVMPTASFSFITAEICRDSALRLQNLSTGYPNPVYLWSSQPSIGVTFQPHDTSASPGVVFLFPGTYTINLDAGNSSGYHNMNAIITVTDCANISGLSNNIISRFIMAPNPANNSVVLRFNGAAERSVEVHSALGSRVLVATAAEQRLELNLEALPSGLYFVEVSENGLKQVSRLIKQ